MTKRDFIKDILRLNPDIRQIGPAAVWIGKPQLIETKRGLRMKNVNITVPPNARITDHYIISEDGIKIKLNRA